MINMQEDKNAALPVVKLLSWYAEMYWSRCEAQTRFSSALHQIGQSKRCFIAIWAVRFDFETAATSVYCGS